MTDYSDHDEVIKLLKDDQQAEHDLREQIQEVINFIHHPRGQWEPTIWDDFEGRPRYTFDMAKPIISKIWAEMAANDYSATTQPIGGGSDKDKSKIIDNLIRKIYAGSSYDDISTRSGKMMIATGMSGWRVAAKIIGESFNQDLVILPIHDFHERVWFDANSEMQTREDAMHVTVVVALGKSKAEAKWPKRDGRFEDITTDTNSEAYIHKPLDKIKIGEILYKKFFKKTIHLMDDGAVYDDDGLSNLNLTAEDAIESKRIMAHKVYSRKFDGFDWLEPEKETVFSLLPIIPEYANFDVIESKVTFEGAIRGIMDHGRVFNYVESRKVEESILAPRTTIWMDHRQADGYVDELSDLNRNPASVQFYKGGIDGAVMPFQTPGPQPNPALTEISGDMVRNVQLSTGLSNVIQEGVNSKRDSDFRFDQRNSMGQMGTFEYYRGHKVALEHTAKVLLDGIPGTYDSQRKIGTMDEAGNASEVEINAKNTATGEILNDLTVGKYDISVKIGPTLESRQTEANTRILELGDRVPGVVERNADIIANNIDAPGMTVVAERERRLLLKNGVIPEDQWTDEEKEDAAQAAQAQQSAPPDPAQQIAEAELQKAQNETKVSEFKALEAQAKLELLQNKQDFEQELTVIKAQMDQDKEQRDAQSQEITDLKTLSETLKTLIESTGAEGAIGPHITEGIINQATAVTEAQSQLDIEQ